MKYVIFFFIFFLSFSPMKPILDSEFPQELPLNSKENFDIKEATKYKIDFSNAQSEKYVHLEVAGKKDNINYVLSIVDDFGKLNRIQLAQSVSGKTNAFAILKEIEGKTLNFILECSDYSDCSGTIKNEFSNKINLVENKPINYYYNIDKSIMEFSIHSQSDLLNIWARGESEIETNLEGAEFITNSEKNFYIVKNTGKNEITFNVTGKKGDFINIGYTGYIQKESPNITYYDLSSKLIKDEYVITVYLNKNVSARYCYNLEDHAGKNENLYLTGIILKDNIVGYFEHSSNSTQDKEYFSETNFFKDQIENYKLICFELEYYSESIFTFQIYSNKGINGKLNIFEPQKNDKIYSYQIKPSTKITLISQGSQNADNIFYYLLSKESFSKLYIIYCDNYPLCSLNDKALNETLSTIKIGRTSTETLKKDEKYNFSPINKHQKLFVVNCDKNAEKDCKFNTLINTNDREISLDYNNFLTKKTFKDQVDKYHFNVISKFNTTSKYIAEINLFSGDVDFITDFPKEIQSTKVVNLNKITLHIESTVINFNIDLKFSIKSLDNSFYTISLFPDTAVDNIKYDNIYYALGFPRLFTFSAANENNTLNIYLMNEDRKSNLLKEFNLNSLNCEIEVSQIQFDKGTYPLKQYGHFFHEQPKAIVDNDNNYQINVTQDVISDYKSKTCNIYLTYKDTLMTRSYENFADLLLIDNTPQQIIFCEKKMTHVSFGYFHEKKESDLIIKYSSKHKAKYIAKISYLGQAREKEDVAIMGDGIIYLNYEEWENICKDQTCFVQIDIDLERADFKENPEPILELSIKSIEEKKVTFIPKGEIVKDYIHYQKSQYYYTELGKNENGFVNVNFLKGSGEIVAKIVEEGKTEQNPDWKGKYALPTKDKADLRMDTFTKKLEFSTEKLNCENKCYLIINVYSNVKADKIPMKRVYPYTILIQSYPSNYKNTDLPTILAPIDEYITGSLNKGKDKDVYDFYQMHLNSNNEKIVIDIHSSIEALLVNIGNKRPTISENDLKFELKKKDNVFVISKEDIKDKQILNFKDSLLTIALYSSKFNETMVKIPYSFIVRMSNESEKDIYRINSEQQTLRSCNNSSSNSNDKLLYLIEYDYLCDFTSLMIYARDADNISKKINIEAKYVDYEDYLFDNLNLTSFDFSNSFNDTKYLFIKNGFNKDIKTNSILVSVDSNGISYINLYTLFYTNYDGIYINPSSPSLKYVPKTQTLSLYVSNLSPSSVNLYSLDGKGELFYEESTHHVLNPSSGPLTLYINNTAKNMIEIKINEINEDNNSTGFVFYLDQELDFNSKYDDVPKTDGGEEPEKDDTTMKIIISVSVVGGVIIIAVIVFVVWYCKKKNLKKDVYKISFEKERESNLLLCEEG